MRTVPFIVAGAATMLLSGAAYAATNPVLASRSEPLRRVEAEVRGRETEVRGGANEVGDDSEKLIEEEECRYFERAVPELVEEVEDEDATRPVGQGVGPIGPGNQDVIPEVPLFSQWRRHLNRPFRLRAG